MRLGLARAGRGLLFFPIRCSGRPTLMLLAPIPSTAHLLGRGCRSGAWGGLGAPGRRLRQLRVLSPCCTAGDGDREHRGQKLELPSARGNESSQSSRRSRGESKPDMSLPGRELFVGRDVVHPYLPKAPGRKHAGVHKGEVHQDVTHLYCLEGRRNPQSDEDRRVCEFLRPEKVEAAGGFNLPLSQPGILDHATIPIEGEGCLLPRPRLPRVTSANAAGSPKVVG